MADLHGAYRALQQCLERSGFDKSQDRLIHLGDIADGYDQVYECVEALSQLPNLVSVKGNHDVWFNEYIRTGEHPDQWKQGGVGTARSYLRFIGKEDPIIPSRTNIYNAILSPYDIPEAHRQFFHQQHLFYIDELNNCYVHGGFDRRQEFYNQDPETFYWDRKLWSAALSWQSGNKTNPGAPKLKMITPFNKVFIGHTSTIYWKSDQPMLAANIWNLDTGCGAGSRLTIMERDTQQYWQSDPTSELY